MSHQTFSLKILSKRKCRKTGRHSWSSFNLQVSLKKKPGNVQKIIIKVITVECLARFCFVVKTSADKMILPIFDIFSHESSLFFKPIEFLGLNKVNGIEKRQKSCKKMSKICQITLSADVFTTGQNLAKHSTVHRGWLI